MKEGARWFLATTNFCNIAPLLAIVFAAVAAYQIKMNDDYYSTNLQVVGAVPTQFQLFRIPSFSYPWSTLFIDVLPITFLSFYEGYAIARKYAELAIHF